jgi:hypothetical protein
MILGYLLNFKTRFCALKSNKSVWISKLLRAEIVSKALLSLMP